MTDVIETVVEIDAETGHELVTCEVSSRDLKEITADTYQTFQLGDDSWIEGFFYHLNETYTGSEEIGYDDFSWTYDNRRWLEYIAEGVIDYIISEQPDEMVKQIDLADLRSPKFYNFETDSFYANWTVDLTMLREWWAGTDFTFEAEMAHGGRHGSHSGFISFIDDRYKEDPLAIEVAMMLDRWIESWSTWGGFLNHVFESVSGNGEQDSCIDMTPKTTAGLLAWVEADYIVTDEMVAAFAGIETTKED